MFGVWGLLYRGDCGLGTALSHRNLFGQPAHDSALEILRRRHAADVITKEQFEEMKRTLG